MKVVKLIDNQEDPSTLSWNMIQLLEESIKEVKDGNLPSKGLIIFFDDSDDCFKLAAWKKAGVLNSEAIVLVELFKDELIEALKE